MHIDYPLYCYSCNQFALHPLGLETEGEIIMDAMGMSVISFRRVVTHDSIVNGGVYRGYLITFRFLLVNGPGFCLWRRPGVLSLRSSIVPRVLKYTDRHMVGNGG